MLNMRRFIRLLAFITTSILALLTFNRQSLWYAIPVIVVGILWYRLGLIHASASLAGFLSFSILLALDVLENEISLWAILAMHAILAQWDLLTYNSRLRTIEITREIEIIAIRHLSRLGYVIVIGMILSVITFVLQTKISLLGIIMCGLVAMIALSRTIIRLRRDTA